MAFQPVRTASVLRPASATAAQTKIMHDERVTEELPACLHRPLGARNDASTALAPRRRAVEQVVVWLGVWVTRKFRVGFFGLLKFQVLKTGTRNSLTQTRI